MHGVGRVCNFLFSLLLISGFVLTGVSADQDAVLKDTLNDITNETEIVTDSIPSDRLTAEPTVTVSVSPEEPGTPNLTDTTTPVPTDTSAEVTPTPEPTPKETVMNTVTSEKTEKPEPTETTTPVPSETKIIISSITELMTDNGSFSAILQAEDRIAGQESFRPIDWSQVKSHGKSPVNPAFLQYQNRTKKAGTNKAKVLEDSSVDSESFTVIELIDGTTMPVSLEGDVPPPLDFSYTQGLEMESDSTSYPATYDLRGYGKVSSVKDQGVAGACWAFATIASLESTLLPGESWDFSENNMKNRLNSTNVDGYDRESIDGGNEWISSAYLTRWSGPVLESDDPYQALGNASPSGLPVYKHIQNVYFLPQRSSATDNDNIKNALMNYGAVKASIYWDSLFYNSTSHAFNNYLTSSLTNHAITIVGWDDSYSRTNFKYQPAGDGAFIVKNSWGTGWGDSGYFYISYYDGTIGNRTVVFTGERITNYDRIYSYDPLGWVGSYGYGTPSAYYANVFTAQSAETLNAIGTYQTYPGSYTARVYLDPVGGPINASGFVAETTWSDSLLGYRTIDIPDVALRQGQKYSVVIFASTPGWNFPVPMENPEAYYSSHATANAGESYISSSGVTWTDMTSAMSNTNVCIKGYTQMNSKIEVFRNGLWVTDYNGNYAWDGPATDRATYLGQAGDVPVIGDWDGDGTDGIGVFRNGLWVIDYNGNYAWDGPVTDRATYLGQAGDVPVIGDWDGDGTDEIGVSRNGLWVTDYNGNYAWDGPVTDRATYLGQAGDVPVIGDWNGDGKDETGVFRNGLWVTDYNGNYAWDGPSIDRAVWLGQTGDVPLAGDWNGDGSDNIGVFRNGLWVIDFNGNYQWDGPVTDRVAWLGQTGDIPVVEKW